jgi:hypothetical protein
VAVKRNLGGGTAREGIFDITFSGTYAAGGDTYTPSLFGMTTIHGIDAMGLAVASATTGFSLMPDYANSKLRLMGGAASGIAGAESAVANQSATVVRCRVTGDGPYI